MFQTGGILKYFEDLKHGTNKEFGPKDFFEIASKQIPYQDLVIVRLSDKP